MKILLVIAVLFLSFKANASLVVNCKNKAGNIFAQLVFEKTRVHVQVTKFKALVYTNKGLATFSEKWNSVTVDATEKSIDGQNGVKFYFASSRAENNLVSFRPYGSTTQELFPGTEGIMVSGLTCDQIYDAVLSEVLN